jgi:hypothetical protein
MIYETGLSNYLFWAFRKYTLFDSATVSLVA